jgi:hypothetical protein
MNFLSERTYSYGKGVEVEEYLFVEHGGIEREVLHHFTDEEDVHYLLRDFMIINTKLSEREVEGKLRSRLVLVAMV